MSAGRLGYNGTIQPALWVTYSANVIASPPPDADALYMYVLANESAFEITLKAKTGAGDFEIGRKSGSGKRFFNDDLNTYVLAPMPASTLEAILDAKDDGSLEIFATIKTWYKPFFLQLVKHMTREGADNSNLANPADPAAVEATFDYKRSGNTAKITHPDEQKEIKDVFAVLESYTVEAPTKKGRPPVVKLNVNLRIFEELTPEQCKAASEILIAADYSKIYKYGSPRASNWCNEKGKFRRTHSNPDAKGIEVCLQVWEKNVANYLWNNTDLDRGEKMLDEICDIAEKEIASPVLDVVQKVRDLIDERIVTANHWADRREDWVTERYQKKLSDLFGAIHQQKWRASPVSFLREFSKENLEFRQGAALILQYGVGHCGEHAQVSFLAIGRLMLRGHDAVFQNIVLTGNANIDHAFVVGGIRASKVIKTKITKATSPGQIGDPLLVWNLKEALDAAPGNEGFVLDPYLAPSVQARTAKQLLVALNADRRGSRKTDFLGFNGQHPPLPAPAEETRASVRNV